MVYALWQSGNSQPLSVPIALKQGEFDSPYFRTYLGGDYQIDLEWLPISPNPDADLDLDWKIVDANGAVIQQGNYSNRLGGNDVVLGHYKSRFGLRQRFIANVHRDIEGESANATLQIGQPEIGLDLSYGFFLLLGWAAIVGGSGTILLCIVLVRRMRQRNAPAA